MKSKNPKRHHESSSLIAPRAIAPDPDAAGEDLADMEALEVPIGHSADPVIDRALSHQFAEPSSTGASLMEAADFPGMLEQKISILNEPEITAQPMHETRWADDAYDAVAPDELGTEWLSRATQTGTKAGYDSEQEVQPDDFFVEAGMSVVSESSFVASHPEIEAEVDAAMNSEQHERELPKVAKSNSGS